MVALPASMVALPASLSAVISFDSGSVQDSTPTGFFEGGCQTLKVTMDQEETSSILNTKHTVDPCP